MRLLPGPNTPVVNFKELKELFLSTDLTRCAELDWIDKEGLRVLDGQDMHGNMVAFQSFPRSGNSMLRRLLETITGIYTGSDMMLDLTI